MADKPKTVRGTLYGATVETSEDNAERLGAAFEPEGKTPARKAATAKKSASSDSK